MGRNGEPAGRGKGVPRVSVVVWWCGGWWVVRGGRAEDSPVAVAEDRGQQAENTFGESSVSECILQDPTPSRHSDHKISQVPDQA